MKFGAEILEGAVCFRLWAPKINQMSIVMNDGVPVAMNRVGRDWHELVSSDAKAGTLYKFQLEDGGMQVPDPAS
jgi:1,4-alpha-glucan branching enzyme/maltooligosyltrehalose trehalohydrolase